MPILFWGSKFSIHHYGKPREQIVQFWGNRKMKGGVLNSNCLMVRKQAFHFPFELLRNLELRARVNDVSSFLFAKLQNSSKQKLYIHIRPHMYFIYWSTWTYVHLDLKTHITSCVSWLLVLLLQVVTWSFISFISQIR